MKIVVFGPERRAGALVGDRIIDLNHGMTRYLRERGEAKPEEEAATRLPSRLLSLIERGAAGVEDGWLPRASNSEYRLLWNLYGGSP